ncbi:hypothetical protein [Agathobaculum hominis]
MINAINRYLHWYCEKQIKLSLVGISPLEYRKSKDMRIPSSSVG